MQKRKFTLKPLFVYIGLGAILLGTQHAIVFLFPDINTDHFRSVFVGLWILITAGFLWQLFDKALFTTPLLGFGITIPFVAAFFYDYLVRYTAIAGSVVVISTVLIPFVRGCYLLILWLKRQRAESNQ